MDHMKYFPEPSDVFFGDVEMHRKYLMPLLSIEPGVVGLDIDTPLHFVCPFEPCDGVIGDHTEPTHSYYCRNNWIAFDVIDGKYRFKGPEDYFLLTYLEKNPETLKGKFPNYPPYETQLPIDLKNCYEKREETYQQLKAASLSETKVDDGWSYGELVQLGGLPADGNWANFDDSPIQRKTIKLSEEEFESMMGGPAQEKWELEFAAAYPLTFDGRPFQFIGSMSGYIMRLLACEMFMFYDTENKVVLCTFDWS